MRHLVQLIDRYDCVIYEYIRCRGAELHSGDAIKLWSIEPTIKKLTPYHGPFAYLYEHGAQLADLSDHKGMIPLDNEAYYEVNTHIFRRPREARGIGGLVDRQNPSVAFACANAPARVDVLGMNATASMAAYLRTTLSDCAGIMASNARMLRTERCRTERPGTIDEEDASAKKEQPPNLCCLAAVS